MKPCSFTGVGSLPHTSSKEAVSHVFSHYEVPFLPQLPNRDPREWMIYQWLSPRSFYGALDDFLEKYDPKKIFKVQVTGPFTARKGDFSGFRLRQGYGGRAALGMTGTRFVSFYIDQVIEFLKRFDVKNKVWVIFDEPFLNESVAQKLFSDLDRVVEKIENQLGKTRFLFGIHSCNRWTPSLFSRFFKTKLRLVSFDVELGDDALFQERQPLFKYLKRGFLLWGIVPTRRLAYKALKGDHFLRYLQTKGLQKKEILNILSCSHFTPACGTATLKLEDEQQIVRKLREISTVTRRILRKGMRRWKLRSQITAITPE